jgi:hypothetical protein
MAQPAVVKQHTRPDAVCNQVSKHTGAGNVARGWLVPTSAVMLLPSAQCNLTSQIGTKHGPVSTAAGHNHDSPALAAPHQNLQGHLPVARLAPSNQSRPHILWGLCVLSRQSP